MDRSKVGEIYYSSEIDTSDLQTSATRAESIVDSSVKKTTKTVDAGSKKMSSSFATTTKSLLALAASIEGLRRIGNFLNDSIQAANKYQSAFAGLDSVARSYNRSQEDARQAAMDLASDGLIPVTDAVTAFKNALASGYSVEEATRLLSGLKDQAAFNRQSYYDLGGAVVATTEGIRNGNSVLADATGTTKNLSVIAKEAGISVQEMGSIQSNAAYRTAVLNGFLQETNKSLGDSARFAQTAAGQDAMLARQFQDLEVKVGNAANAIRYNFVRGLQEFLVQNQNTIISVGAGASAMVAFAGAAYVLGKALSAIPKILTLIARHPVVAILTLTVGLFASFVASNVLEKMTEGLFDVGEGGEAAGAGLAQANEQASKLQKQLDKINRDYNESLAELVKRHEDSIKELTSQVEDENSNYNQAFRERLQDFTEEQYKEQDEHEKKIKNLQNQIDFLRRYNNASNRQQLSETQFALAKEKAEYDKRLAERVANYDADVEAERLAHEKRLLDLNTRLQEETDLLDRHADDLAAIRGVILLDEIDKLKRSRDEQIASAQEAVNGINNTYNSLGSSLEQSMEGLGDTAGTAMGEAFMQALKDAIKKTWDDLWNGLFGGLKDAYVGLQTGLGLTKEQANNNFKNSLGRPTTILNSNSLFSGLRGFDVGGFTGRGSGNNIAGVVHDGEYVVPPEFVDQTTGMPNSDFLDQFGTGGVAQNTTINVKLEGIVSSSPADERMIAERFVKRFNEVAVAKGLAKIGV